MAGGQQQLYGLFVQDVYTPIPQLEIVGGIRGDYWLAYDAFRRDTPPPAGVPARQTFSDIDRMGASPRLALLYHATPSTDLRASVYQGFRVPTINELYRVFRVRNDVTVANEHLAPRAAHRRRARGARSGWARSRRGPPRSGTTCGTWSST